MKPAIDNRARSPAFRSTLEMKWRTCGSRVTNRFHAGEIQRALSDQMLAAPLTVVDLGHEQSVPIF